MNMILRFRFVY